MEQEFENLFDLHWKGFRSYNELTKEEQRIIKHEYSAEDFHEALKAAYNAGIQIAADNTIATVKVEYWGLGEDHTAIIDKESILKLQIK